ncbi:MAG: C40 family peptidase [Solirubrobacterales bacterium]
MPRIWTSLLLMIAIVLGLGAPVLAAEHRYVVQQGDNLWDIAGDSQCSVDELKRLNSLQNDKLKLGQVLILPGPPAEEKVQEAANAIPVVAPEPSRNISALSRVIVAEATSLIGTPYRYGGNGGHGFDCSGFVRHVFAKVGINLPHQSASMASLGKPVSKTDLSVGDLVFFKTQGSGHINHVGIYLSGSRFIHASIYKGITVNTLNEQYYIRTYATSRRIL